MATQEITFQVTRDLNMSTAYSTLYSEKNVLIECNLRFRDETYGSFELYDDETGGDHWYAEGGLWIEDKVITGYDGVFELPDFILDKLAELGYDISEVDCRD